MVPFWQGALRPDQELNEIVFGDLEASGMYVVSRRAVTFKPVLVLVVRINFRTLS